MERSGPKNRTSGIGSKRDRSEAGAERERDLKKYGGAGRGSGAVSRLNRLLTIRSNSNLTMTDFVSYHTFAFCSQFLNFEIEHVLLSYSL